MQNELNGLKAHIYKDGKVIYIGELSNKIRTSNISVKDYSKLLKLNQNEIIKTTSH